MEYIKRFITIIIDLFDIGKERKAKMAWAGLFILSFLRYNDKLDGMYYIITVLCLLGYYNIANLLVKKVYISNDKLNDKKNEA